MTAPMLRCEGLDVAYGPVQVLFGVDLDVDEREVVGLLGTNGAGKSTLLRAICGLTPVRRGKIWFEGEEITNADPAALAAKGIGFMPGGRGVFPGLSVAENLRMAGWLIRKEPARLDAAVERAFSLFPILEERRDQRAALLSGGQQQMLALAQTLINEPRLLMIDELSLGLAPVVVGELMGVVERLTDEGTTIILVEQSVNIALALTRRAIFMEKGEVRFSGDTAELAQRSDLVRSVFIGGSTSKKEDDGASTRRRATHDNEIVLSVSSVSKRFGGIAAVDDVSFDVRAGEVVGILGANGAGKTTLLDLLTGFVPVDGGRVTLHGQDVTELGPDERAAQGMARSFQDARLFAGLTVDDNMAVALEQFAVSREPFAAAFHLPISVLSESLIAREVEELTSSLGLVAFRDKFASQLSTGSRRVVEFGSLVAQRGDVLLLDEPTGGLAQAESEALGPLLRRLCDATGSTLVVVEHDVPLLVALCDRLIAMELGAVIADGPPQEVIDDPRVIASYLGTEESAISRSGGRDRPAGSNGKARAAAARRSSSTNGSSPANGESATAARRRRRTARKPIDDS